MDEDFIGEIEGLIPEESSPDEFETVKRDMIDELEEMEGESERDILEVYLEMLEGKFEGWEVGLGPLDMPKERLMGGLHDFIEDVGEPPSVVQYKSSRYWKGADRPLTQLHRELHDDGRIFYLDDGRNKRLVPRGYPPERLPEDFEYKLEATREYPDRDEEEAAVLRFLSEEGRFENQREFMESARERGITGGYKKFHSVLERLKSEGLVSRPKSPGSNKIIIEYIGEDNE